MQASCRTPPSRDSQLCSLQLQHRTINWNVNHHSCSRNSVSSRGWDWHIRHTGSTRARGQNGSASAPSRCHLSQVGSFLPQHLMSGSVPLWRFYCEASLLIFVFSKETERVLCYLCVWTANKNPQQSGDPSMWQSKSKKHWNKEIKDTSMDSLPLPPGSLLVSPDVSGKPDLKTSVWRSGAGSCL